MFMNSNSNPSIPKLTGSYLREEAAKKFNRWQEEWRLKVKAKLVQDKKKKLEEVENLRSEAKEKKEAAELAFKAWKAKKEEERKKSSPIKTDKVKKSTPEDKSKRLEAAREA